MRSARPALAAQYLALFYGLLARGAKERLARLEELFGLTPREREIAGAVFISPHTVKNTTSRSYEKIGVRTRGQLVGRII